MLLTDYVPPVFWSDKGMDWTNPDPAKADYINALKLALLERGWPSEPLCFPGNPISISDINDVASGIGTLAYSPHYTPAFYEPRLTASGFPFQNLNDRETSCISVLPPRCCLHSDLVGFFRNAKNALNRMICPRGIRVTHNLALRHNYPAVIGYENEKNYEQIVDEAKATLSENLYETEQKTLVSTYIQNYAIVSYRGTSISIPGTSEYKKTISVEFCLQDVEFDFSDILTEDDASLKCYVFCNVTPSGSGILDMGDTGLQAGMSLLVFDVDKQNTKIKIGNSFYYPIPEKPAIGSSVRQGFSCSLQLIMDVSKLGIYHFV